MMNLEFTADQRALRDTFERFFAVESSIDRVRAAEAGDGFDRQLWKALGGMGALGMRGSPELGGGVALLDTLLIVHEAGRRLASVPLVEGVVAGRILAKCSEQGAAWFERLALGDAVVTLALDNIADVERQIVHGGNVADAVIGRHGDRILLIEQSTDERSPRLQNLGQIPLARPCLQQKAGGALVLAEGADAIGIFEAAVEEWKLLQSALLVGMAREGIEMAATYAGEREAFGKPIGAYQGISHVLADAKTRIEGAWLLLCWTVEQVGRGEPEAAAMIDMGRWWAETSASWALQRSLHTFGGYGLSLEYPIQLVYRRAKAISAAAGDPQRVLISIADRLWGDKQPAMLPEVGDVGITFDYGEVARTYAAKLRGRFEQLLTPEKRAKAHYAYEGHDWDVVHALGKEQKLYPAWPKKYGGGGADNYVQAAARMVWDEFRWSKMAPGTTDFVGHMIMWFGGEALKGEVLPVLARGETFCSLGYTEPSGGSDVFAARTTAVRDGNDWVINGQKIFTSGAELAGYIFLLARTDAKAPKHKGLTMFLVPTNSAGFEYHPIHTLMNERTNTTFYTNVRVADHYRIGDVNGGVQVLAAALTLEQGGGGVIVPFRQMIELAVQWAQTHTTRNGRAIDDPLVASRLARAVVHQKVADVLYRQALWAVSTGRKDQAYGPMSKLLATEYYLADATDLMDMTAPDSIIDEEGISQIDKDHRRGLGFTVYGGTSEVLRSQIAEKTLGMARTRN